MSVKYVFVTGGVVSSLGKGITAASLGRLLKARGYKISMQKMDPYYNVDPGLLSPLQHGEAFITDDGIAADLDLGHYERFTDIALSKGSSVTTGKIHRTLMERELRGEYKGGTVQVIPHVTNEIKFRIRDTAQKAGADIAIIEIGGTVGDMEGAPYLEAIRQMGWEEGPHNCCFIHLTLLPYIGTSKELKTKPTQHSVRELRSIGIQPNVLVCRSNMAITEEARGKMALFCNVKPENVIFNGDADVLYEVPLLLEKEGLAETVLKELEMDPRTPDLTAWENLVDSWKHSTGEVKVAFVAKYAALPDAYLSVVEALTHAAIPNKKTVRIKWINPEDLNEGNIGEELTGMDGIIAPGGYGARGAEGVILTAAYARENKIPYLAIGYGMQLTVVEAARTFLKLEDANSTEVNEETANPIVRVPKDRMNLPSNAGGSRMGAYTMVIESNCLMSECYDGAREISERHGNRYEINPGYATQLKEKGYLFPVYEKTEGYIEAIELPSHPFYLGVIYHPEFKSRPDRPHPLFVHFMQAILNK